MPNIKGKEYPRLENGVVVNGPKEEPEEKREPEKPKPKVSKKASRKKSEVSDARAD